MRHKKDRDLHSRLAVPYSGRFRLSSRDSRDDCGFRDKEWARDELAREQELLNDLQTRLFAESKHSLLIVLQAMDTGGKDSTIRSVLGPLNPQGVVVTGFKRPTPEELAHDYLWRIHRAAPRQGMIAVFNRSHYEDVLAVKVHRLAPAKRISERYGQINDFEKMLAANGTAILKFHLRISRKEQKERLQDRLDVPRKNWKFDPGDLAERRLWDRYMKAYQTALEKCSRPHAPWYVIPADRKWVRNLAVARVIRMKLEALKPRYPRPAPGLRSTVIED